MQDSDNTLADGLDPIQPPPNAPDPAGEAGAATEDADPASALGPTIDLGDGETWSPPAIDPATGVALDGPDGLPINHRLRAEALVRSGADEDPDGTISADLLADTATRLEGEDKAAKLREAENEKAFPAIRENMKTADLDRIGTAHGLDLSGAANNAERVRIITDAREAGTARPANEGTL